MVSLSNRRPLLVRLGALGLASALAKPRAPSMKTSGFQPRSTPEAAKSPATS